MNPYPTYSPTTSPCPISPTTSPYPTYPMAFFPTPTVFTPFPMETTPTTFQPSQQPSMSATIIQPSEQQPALPSTSNKTCLTQSTCEGRQQQMGFANFYAGTYEDFGCFSRNNNLFWGIGGTEEQMSTSDLSKKKERVWCE